LWSNSNRKLDIRKVCPHIRSSPQFSPCHFVCGFTDDNRQQHHCTKCTVVQCINKCTQNVCTFDKQKRRVFTAEKWQMSQQVCIFGVVSSLYPLKRLLYFYLCYCYGLISGKKHEIWRSKKATSCTYVKGLSASLCVFHLTWLLLFYTNTWLSVYCFHCIHGIVTLKPKVRSGNRREAALWREQPGY
jgi:hypothetical protein